MPQPVLSSFVQLLRRAAARHVRDEHGDADLLARFAQEGDDAAFEILVHRHGPLVWSVCRRLLRRTEDVEDAFQAVFLVFLRRAASIREGALLSNWLYGVSCRVAMRARAVAARRGEREKLGTTAEPMAAPDEPAAEWQPILHEEVFRLPEKFRQPVVLCYLNGKTNEEAARDLGWPVGTVKGRLSQARDLLRGRLTRRGVSLPAAALGTTLAAARLEAAVPPLLVKSTLSGAAAGNVGGHALILSKGVIHAMFWNQCTTVAKTVLMLALLGTGASISFYSLAAKEQNNTPQARVETAAVAAQPESKPAPTPLTAADRQTSVNNLKILALALHNYHDQYGHFPPAAVYSNDGRPLLSWRVLILPYVDEANLFREFKLDQPWDSPHNKKLLARMPKVYQAPKIKTKEPHATFYQVFAGKGTMFDGMRGSRITDITDGTSNTIMLIEAGVAVPWTKPADLPYDAKKALPRLGGICLDGFNFACADGSVRFCKKQFREAALRDMITPAGGEVLMGNPDE